MCSGFLAQCVPPVMKLRRRLGGGPAAGQNLFFEDTVVLCVNYRECMVSSLRFPGEEWGKDMGPLSGPPVSCLSNLLECLNVIISAKFCAEALNIPGCVGEGYCSSSGGCVSQGLCVK